jgi:hypothetical protein
MSPNSRELKEATSLRSPLNRGRNLWAKLIISPGFTSLENKRKEKINNLNQSSLI